MKQTLTNYSRLVRLPNVFTAIADVAMGFLFVQQSLRPVLVFGCLVMASASLYLAGMVLNDLWDIDTDRLARPNRPLPAGQISTRAARRLGFGLLGMGMVFGWSAGYLNLIADVLPWRAGMVATLLAGSVVLYDRVLKRTILGPVGMGACRFLNVLLGMAVAVPISGPISGPNVWLGFAPYHMLIAAGIGVYIVGVTWLARTEARVSSRPHLAMATLVMAAGIALLGLVDRWLPVGFSKTLSSEGAWLMLLGLLAFTIVRRSIKAVANPTPQNVQWAVKNAIWSLIVLDASVVLLVCPPVWSLLILLLLVPTLAFGRWIDST